MARRAVTDACITIAGTVVPLKRYKGYQRRDDVLWVMLDEPREVLRIRGEESIRALQDELAMAHAEQEAAERWLTIAGGDY